MNDALGDVDTGEQEEWSEDMNEDANICESDFGSQTHHDDIRQGGA